jgi:hypothetical protein
MLIYAILCAACDRPVPFHSVVLCENWQKHLDFLVGAVYIPSGEASVRIHVNCI